MSGKTIRGMYLVCLHPNNENKSFQRIKVPDLSQEIKDLFALLIFLIIFAFFVF